MKFSSKCFKILVLSLVMMVCALGSAYSAENAFVEIAPYDCSFCLCINDLNGSLAKLDQYLTGVSPMPISAMVKMQLGAVVGDPMLTGIEMNGTFAVIGLSDMTVGVVVPVTDFAEFVKTNPNCNQAEGEIALLKSPKSPMGAFVMTPINSKYALVLPESEKENLVILKAAFAKESSPLISKLTKAQIKDATDAPIWGYVNAALLYDKFSPAVLAQLENVENDMPEEMAGSMGDLMTFYFKFYKETFTQLVGDADFATAAITPDAKNLSIDVTLSAKKGSELAKMLVADPKSDGTFKFAGYLDNDNAVNGLMKINPESMGRMYAKMFDILEAANDSEDLEKQVVKMKLLTNKMLTTMGDEIAISFSYAAGKPPLKVREVFAVRDMDTMKELTKDMIEIADDFYASLGLPMKLEYQSDGATYKNATIEKMVIAFPPSDDPDDPMQAAMENLYGGNLVYSLAHTGDTYYVAMGQDSEADVKALIDQDASASPAGETKAAIDLLKDTPYNDSITSINVIKLMAGMGEMLKTMGPVMSGIEGKPNPVADIFGGLNIESGSSIAIGTQIDDGQVGIRTVVPKQHLMEIMGAVMQIQMKMMTPPQGGVSAPAPAPAHDHDHSHEHDHAVSK